jgi:hypothetical protein
MAAALLATLQKTARSVSFESCGSLTRQLLLMLTGGDSDSSVVVRQCYSAAMKMITR